MMVFLSLAAPKDVEAHIAAVGQAPPGYVYDLYNPWDGTHVGWFTHDKKVSGSVKWYTKGYYVTTYPLLDYTIPAGALLVAPLSTAGLPSADCTESGYVDTLHLFESWKVMNWVMQSGASISDDGVATVYAQPVIGTKHKKDGAWVDDGKTLMSLSSWVNAKSWANTSTFASHYNKPLRVVRPPATEEEKTHVRYQTLNAGEGYSAGKQLSDDASFAYNLGSLHSFTDTGLIKCFDTDINGETRRFVLAGVQIDKPVDCATGSVGRLAVNTEENNLLQPSGVYSLASNSLSSTPNAPGSGWTFNKDYSSMYSYVGGYSFRVSTSTTITYLYAEVKTVCKLYTAMRYDGYNSFNVLNANSPYKVNAGEAFNYSGETALVPAIASYKGYVWELVQASFYKKGANILSVPTVYAPNASWGGSGSTDFRTANIMGSAVDYNAWRQYIADNNKVSIQTSADSPYDYVYTGRYQVAAPQIELSYYKDSKGQYHLFSYTSCGAALDESQPLESQYRKNTWLDNGATTKYTVKSILKNQDVNIDGKTTKKTMVLTQSYAYVANNVDSVAGYNGNVNCWTSSSLPINGSIEAGTRFSVSNSQDAYDVAMVDGKITKRTTECAIKKSPIIFVTVYEGGPVLTVKSYYTTEKVETDSRKYYYEGASGW